MNAVPASCRVHTLCLDGPRAASVELELQLTGGLMQRIVMTGLPGGAVKESRDRIRGCLERAGFPVPRRSVLANFAPADLHKDGGGFDLPLALGLLALGELVPHAALAERAIIGELALDGRLRAVRGALALALEARRLGTRRLLLPRANGAEASLVRGLIVEAVDSLQEALDVLRGAPARPAAAPRVEDPSRLDLCDVRGQPSARRALEIAAAGGHNLLLCGPPGTGKTMLAQRLAGLLPPLGEEESLEVSALHGLVQSATATIHTHPPFRAPHHTVSRAGLVGGGQPIQPGEVSLAHRGVLFLDELAEFPRSLLEALRQPLEDGRVVLARAGRAAVFPARVQVLGAMNPCVCGFLGHPRKGCRCTPHQIATYRQRISGPLLDRFDLHVEMPVPEPAELLGEQPEESSRAVAARVLAARARVRPAAPLPAEPATRRRLELALSSFALSARAVTRLVRVARTIALLDGRGEASADDVDEALSFRRGLLEFGRS